MILLKIIVLLWLMSGVVAYFNALRKEYIATSLQYETFASFVIMFILYTMTGPLGFNDK